MAPAEDFDRERAEALRAEEERAKHAAQHDMENWTRKRPEQDPVHLVAVSLPGQPPRRALVTWSLLARLTRNGAAGKLTDLGAVKVDFDPGAFGNGTRILWLKEGTR